jgi:hypothetical protein
MFLLLYGGQAVVGVINKIGSWDLVESRNPWIDLDQQPDRDSDSESLAASIAETLARLNKKKWRVYVTQ